MDCLSGVFDYEPQIVKLEWLRNVIVGARFYGFNRHAFRAVRGDDDHERCIAVCAFELAEKVQSAQAGKIHIEEEQVRLVLFE